MSQKIQASLPKTQKPAKSDGQYTGIAIDPHKKSAEIGVGGQGNITYITPLRFL